MLVKRKWVKTLLVTFFLLGGIGFGILSNIPSATAAPTSNLKIYPVDHSTDDLSFMEFKLNLLKAIAKKDAEYIFSIITPETNLSFGGDHGVEGLKKLWGLPEDNNSSFWSTLERLIKLGCVRQTGPGGTWYYAPYTFANFKGEDSFTVLIITGYSVNLREKPVPTATILEKLDYDVVKIADLQNYSLKSPWVKVISPAGNQGYISRQYLISPVDYRAGFKKIDGQWKMLFFVAGD